MSTIKCLFHKFLTIGGVIGLIILVGAIDASASPSYHGTGILIEEPQTSGVH